MIEKNEQDKQFFKELNISDAVLSSLRSFTSFSCAV